MKILLSFLSMLLVTAGLFAQTNTTASVTSIASTTATSGGGAIYTMSSPFPNFNYEATVMQKGVCWSTSSNPVYTSPSSTNNGMGVGAFTSNLTNLSPGTTYYVRAYVVYTSVICSGAMCVVYFNQVSFTTAPVHWEYGNSEDWPSEGYPLCAGATQSPVDINSGISVSPGSVPITFNYKKFKPLILDNGHTLQVINNGKNSLTYMDSTYNFLQFHFHARCEHTIDGDSTPVEIHLVHQNTVSGTLLVISLWVNQGAQVKQLNPVLNNWPGEEGDTTIGKHKFNLYKLVPLNKKSYQYYTYTGSLTTPPCSPGVTFILLKKPITMSASQIQIFTNHYSNSYRSVQPLNSRVISLFNN